MLHHVCPAGFNSAVAGCSCALDNPSWILSSNHPVKARVHLPLPLVSIILNIFCVNPPVPCRFQRSSGWLLFCLGVRPPLIHSRLTCLSHHYYYCYPISSLSCRFQRSSGWLLLCLGVRPPLIHSRLTCLSHHRHDPSLLRSRCCGVSSWARHRPCGACATVRAQVTRR